MDIVKILLHIRPGAEWSLNGDTYDGLVWTDKVQNCPTREEVEGAWEPTKAALVSAKNTKRIESELSALDLKRIRPLAEGDATYLAVLNDQARQLREQLR